MESSEWFLVFTATLFQFPAWMAFKRLLWIRWLGMHFITAVALWYHSCNDLEVCATNDTQQSMDHLGALWFTTSMPLLLAHFKSQATELLVEVAIILGAVIMVSNKWEQDDMNCLLFSGAISVLVIGLTWIANHGPPPLRIPWVATGFSLLTAGGVLFFVAGHGDLWIHGSWHITGAVGATFAIYGARDPTYMPDYHLMSDVLLKR